MNVGFLSGFISSDIKSETLTLKDGKTMEKAKFSIAVKRDFGDGTDFIWVETLGKNAELIGRFFHKGRGITVRYHVQTGDYTTKEGKKVYTESKIIDHWEFPPVKKSEENATESEMQQTQPIGQPMPQEQESEFMKIPDQAILDSLPFR